MKMRRLISEWTELIRCVLYLADLLIIPCKQLEVITGLISMYLTFLHSPQ